MKKLILTSLLILGLGIYGGKASAQQNGGAENFGNTLNLGLGLGYYGYVGYFTPVINANYEFQLANNFTLAPFVTVYSYRKRRKIDGDHYYYRQTVIPVGAKGTYYFDKLLGLNSRWDIYGAGSLGFAIRSSRWEDGYYGDGYFYRGSTALYLDAHIGAEYHASQKVGLYLDLSTSLSTFGVGIHL